MESNVEPDFAAGVEPQGTVSPPIAVNPGSEIRDPKSSVVSHQFETAEQQREVGTLGMWTFLATEVLFFGGAMLAYIVYRSLYFEAFAEGSHYLDVVLGGINTAVLLTSSLMMALAVNAAHEGRRGATTLLLLITIVLGFAFLGIKAYEYYEKWEESVVPGLKFQFAGSSPGQTELYFFIYFALTGIHALHMIIGIGILSTLIIMNQRGKFNAAYNSPVEISGLYWHFVDIVWIFLYPLLYLIRVR